MIIRIECPWPPASLTPNAKRRLHWSKYRVPARSYRKMCWALTLEAMGTARFAAPPAVRIEFHPPDKSRRDDDNTISTFKNGRDGISDATGFDDHHWRPVYSFHPPHRPAGKVVVVLEGEAAP